MADYYSGRVTAIIFENEAQSFYILRMVLDDRTEPIVVRGDVIGLDVVVGIWFGFEGNWTHHADHGKQLLITRAPVVKEWTSEVAVGVLNANGVSSFHTGLIHSYYRDDLIDVLNNFDPVLFECVPGLDEKQALHIVDRWKMAKAYYRTLEFLADAGVPRRQVQQVWSAFGDNAEQILALNPWALCKIDGITFAQAEEVAAKLGLRKDNPLRVEGAVRFVVKSNRGMGHLYLTTGEVFSEVEALIGAVQHTVIAQCIANLHRDKQIVVDSKTRPGIKAIYEPWFYRIEIESAIRVYDRVGTARLDRNEDVLLHHVTAYTEAGTNAADAALKNPTGIRKVAEAALVDWSLGSKVTLSTLQLEGVVNALVEPVSIITGLPGTGKSTSLRATVSILKDAGISMLLVAPTGIAAKRMTALTGAPASTIHRAFGAQGWNKGEERAASYVGITGQSGGLLEGSDGSGELWECSEVPHNADVIIIDEISMVDQHLLYRILECTKPTTRLVFIGDAQQLPSVGPGNVLRDLIASGLFPTVSLTEIFRQVETSQIVTAAHAICRGEIPPVGQDATSDFVLLPAKAEADILDLVVRLSARMYAKRENFQVMSPRHSGTVGVTNLNTQLREPINPKKSGLQEMRLGSETIREDDRIMVVRNNYELGVFNGDVGKVHKLDRKDKRIEVKIHGPPIQYVNIPFKDAASYLRLSYCTTVHKMQGQEADTIIIPLVTAFGPQLQRNLLYTAITRAKKRVIMVGHHDAFVRAIHNNHQDARNTLFLDRLLAHAKKTA